MMLDHKQTNTKLIKMFPTEESCILNIITPHSAQYKVVNLHDTFLIRNVKEL